MAAKRKAYELAYLHVSSGSAVEPIASAVLRVNGREVRDCSYGKGSIDALFKSLKKISGTDAEFKKLSINSLGEETEAPGKAVVRLAKEGKTVNGAGCDCDILTACAQAYIDALNKLDRARPPSRKTAGPANQPEGI